MRRDTKEHSKKTGASGTRAIFKFCPGLFSSRVLLCLVLFSFFVIAPGLCLPACLPASVRPSICLCLSTPVYLSIGLSVTSILLTLQSVVVLLLARHSSATAPMKPRKSWQLLVKREDTSLRLKIKVWSVNASREFRIWGDRDFQCQPSGNGFLTWFRIITSTKLEYSQASYLSFYMFIHLYLSLLCPFFLYVSLSLCLTFSIFFDPS